MILITHSFLMKSFGPSRVSRANAHGCTLLAPTPATRVMRSASRSASAPRSHSAGPRPLVVSKAHAARSHTLEIQVHSYDGRLRPDPAFELARFARITSRL